ncbi:retrovirus-related pol polyprotein from transposon TNT 1-94, partial [Tanacetum coccineum]
MKFWQTVIEKRRETRREKYNNQKNQAQQKDVDGDDDSDVVLRVLFCSHEKNIFNLTTPGDFGMELVLHNVKHVPDMRLNIISTGLLDEDGYHNSSGNGLWKVTLGSLIVARGKWYQGLPAFAFWGEAHEYGRVWSGKDVSYHHFKPCVFLGYGQDELGYRTHSGGRNRDVEFDEDQTLKDVEKTEKETIPQHNDDPIDLDPVPPKHFDAQFGDDIQNDEEQNDEEHGADDVDAQEQPNLDEDV